MWENKGKHIQAYSGTAASAKGCTELPGLCKNRKMETPKNIYNKTESG